jgi:hypothetical protein
VGLLIAVGAGDVCRRLIHAPWVTPVVAVVVIVACCTLLGALWHLRSMGRLLIVGLGLAGQLAMASAVVAAKSVIRFPEINAKRDKNGHPERVGIDDVTEYILVGSLASWILALGSLALVAASHQVRRRCRDGPVGSVPGLDATTMVAQK